MPSAPNMGCGNLRGVQVSFGRISIEEDGPKDF